MIIGSDVPELTVDEIDRLWIPPPETCWLAAASARPGMDMAKFLSNIADRGHVPVIKSGEDRGSPRLYSCTSAIMLRTMLEVLWSGRTYEFAAAIAKHVADRAREWVVMVNHLDHLDQGPDGWPVLWLVLYEADTTGKPVRIRWVHADEIVEQLARGGYDQGVLKGGDVIWNVLRGYAYSWEKDLTARGLLVEEPRAIGADRWPLP